VRLHRIFSILAAILTTITALLAIAMPAGPAHAACAASVPLQHLGLAPGDRFECDDTTGVSALAWLQTDPLGTQSGLAPIACEGSGTECAGGGALGDFAVTIEGDWSRSGMVGCPTAASPQARVGLVVQAADGAGLIVLLTRDRLGAGSGYSVTGAQKFDDGSLEPIPLACGQRAGRPAILSVNPGTPGQIQVTAQFPQPSVVTDCDVDSVATSFVGPCAQPPAPNPARGPVYVRAGPCTTRLDLRRAAWSPTGVTPDTAGVATISAAAPVPGECLYIGGTTRIEAIESGAVTGFASIPGGPCVDADGDGITNCAGDCDDADPGRAPNHAETCDGVDQDCDGRIDEGLDCASTCAAPVVNGADLRVTTAPGTSTEPSLVWTGDLYGIAWTDDRDGTYGIYFNRLADSGARLGPDRRITPPGVMAVSPALVWTGSGFGLAWTDRRNGAPEIYFTRLAPDGSSVGQQVRVTPGAFAQSPAITVAADGFGVVWAADYPLVGGNDLFFWKLDPLGAPIGDARQVTNAPVVESAPRIAALPAGFGVAWNDSRVDPGNPEIFFAPLDADGNRSGPDQRISFGAGTSEDVQLAATTDGFGAVWKDFRSGHAEVFAARLDPLGRPLSEVQVTSEDAYSSADPAIAWNGAQFRVAWADGRAGGSDIYIAALDAFGLRVGPETRLSNHVSHTATLPSLAVAGSGAGVAWMDHRDGDFEIYMSRLGCHCVDEDGDGYSACVECDDRRPEIHPGAAEACNGEDDDCNGFVDDDAAGFDTDSDAVPNACDNCRFVSNLDQADIDHDGEGDLCDIDDGLIIVTMRSPGAVQWQVETGMASFNLYRGLLPGLVDPDGDGAASVYGTCLASGVTGPIYNDPAMPPLGRSFLYLVTGRGPAGETSLGVASSGAPRPNPASCP
jgi:Putative metal-binding motif